MSHAPEQLEMWSVEAPSEQQAQPARCALAPGSPWVESWHNSELRYCDVPAEHQIAALSERGKWLFTGPRWPINPTPAMLAHCEARWIGVAKWMRVHGWWCEWSDWDPIGKGDPCGWVVTWKHRDDGIYQLQHCGGVSAAYVGIIGAALVRRKARYYGLWRAEPSAMKHCNPRLRHLANVPDEPRGE